MRSPENALLCSEVDHCSEGIAAGEGGGWAHVILSQEMKSR